MQKKIEIKKLTNDEMKKVRGGNVRKISDHENLIKSFESSKLRQSNIHVQIAQDGSLGAPLHEGVRNLIN
jgi:hypothetical protein